MHRVDKRNQPLLLPSFPPSLPPSFLPSVPALMEAPWNEIGSDPPSSFPPSLPPCEEGEVSGWRDEGGSSHRSRRLRGGGREGGKEGGREGGEH